MVSKVTEDNSLPRGFPIAFTRIRIVTSIGLISLSPHFIPLSLSLPDSGIRDTEIISFHNIIRRGNKNTSVIKAYISERFIPPSFSCFPLILCARAQG